MPDTLMQFVKDYLVRLGPNSVLVQAALRVHGLRHGYNVTFTKDSIKLRRGEREMILNKAQYVQVPIMIECYNLFFDTIEGRVVEGRSVLDFSQPGLQTYRKSGIAFYFPSVPEDDVVDAYVQGYMPQPGDVVWDAGAYAGASAYFFAQMVGPGGKVYAFEPDQNNYDYLLRNIELHKLTNVIPVKMALSGSSGTAEFNMDGSMSAGLSDYLAYSKKTTFQTVETISFEDACAKFGGVPAYVKMDIEGAEVAMIQSALGFLKSHPVNFAIESYHLVDGELTWKPLEKLFSSIGYEAWSSDKYGQMFTWAKPKQLI
jgi:FkbM family methyltransferase